MNIVKFKSIPKYYEKEKDGRKPNTLRNFKNSLAELDHREELLLKFMRKRIRKLYIKIENTSDPNDFFVREVIDVTYYEGFYIISYKHISYKHKSQSCDRVDNYSGMNKPAVVKAFESGWNKARESFIEFISEEISRRMLAFENADKK